MSAEKYGEYFWNITTPKESLMIYADDIQVTPSGALVVYGGYRKDDLPPENVNPLLAFAANQWVSFSAASMFTGAAVCCDSSIDLVKKK